MVDDDQGYAGKLALVVDIAQPVDTGSVERDNQVVVGADLTRAANGRRPWQEEKLLEHGIVHGCVRPFAERVQDELHAKHAAVGVAVGVDMAPKQNVLALADEIDQANRDSVVHSLELMVSCDPQPSSAGQG